MATRRSRIVIMDRSQIDAVRGIGGGGSSGSCGLIRGAATIGDGVQTEFVIPHGGDTVDLVIQVLDLTSGTLVIPHISDINPSTFTVRFASPPMLDQYRVVWIISASSDRVD